eukprot:TRINITY_DN11241_c0_g1_i1.p1 TRINITY_DN11241_c0_g1~~TRINITY_DN11241_c0_g1_i1.p1  ORF type:complete len:936 (+),score=185.60 TRINITY_DN11241_c0_g1_i1:89-2896(+)
MYTSFVAPGLSAAPQTLAPRPSVVLTATSSATSLQQRSPSSARVPSVRSAAETTPPPRRCFLQRGLRPLNAAGFDGEAVSSSHCSSTRSLASARSRPQASTVSLQQQQLLLQQQLQQLQRQRQGRAGEGSLGERASTEAKPLCASSKSLGSGATTAASSSSQAAATTSQRLPAYSEGLEVHMHDHSFCCRSVLGRGSYSEVWRADVIGGPSGLQEAALKEVLCRTQGELQQALFEVQVLLALWKTPEAQTTPVHMRVPQCICYKVEPVADGWKVRSAMTVVPGTPLDAFARRPPFPATSSSETARARGCALAAKLLRDVAPMLQLLSPLAWHRDVNSHNILCHVGADNLSPEALTEQSSFWLVDFGLAVDAQSWVTANGRWRMELIGGDSRYWPPSSWIMHLLGPEGLESHEKLCEQYQWRLDVHGLGITAVELLCSIACPGKARQERREEDGQDVWQKLYSVWQRYRSEVWQWWTKVYSAFAAGSDIAPVQEHLLQLGVVEKHIAMLAELREALRTCAEDFHTRPRQGELLHILANMLDDECALDFNQPSFKAFLSEDATPPAAAKRSRSAQERLLQQLGSGRKVSETDGQSGQVTPKQRTMSMSVFGSPPPHTASPAPTVLLTARTATPPLSAATMRQSESAFVRRTASPARSMSPMPMLPASLTDAASPRTASQDASRRLGGRQYSAGAGQAKPLQSRGCVLRQSSPCVVLNQGAAAPPPRRSRSTGLRACEMTSSGAAVVATSSSRQSLGRSSRPLSAVATTSTSRTPSKRTTLAEAAAARQQLEERVATTCSRPVFGAAMGEGAGEEPERDSWKADCDADLSRLRGVRSSLTLHSLSSTSLRSSPWPLLGRDATGEALDGDVEHAKLLERIRLLEESLQKLSKENMERARLGMERLVRTYFCKVTESNGDQNTGGISTSCGSGTPSAVSN